MNPWVVKLGGSLAHSAELPQWLDVIATGGAGKVVLVPGGGPWADDVRKAQKREGFDDHIAHRKALRAMEHYGRVLCAARSGLVEAENTRAIQKVLQDAKVAVWMPYEMVVADESIPQTWDVTSDSLSAWLARELGATLLVLVKSVSVADSGMPAAEMTKRNWVDARFDEFCANGDFQYCVLGHGDHRRLARMLAGSVADTPIEETVGSGG
jgi:aspartokinase-like uncharacterized kinase